MMQYEGARIQPQFGFREQNSTLEFHGKDFRTLTLRMTLMSRLAVSLQDLPSTPPSRMSTATSSRVEVSCLILNQHGPQAQPLTRKPLCLMSCGRYPETLLHPPGRLQA